MYYLRKVLFLIRTSGLKSALVFIIKKITGRDKLEEEIDTLYYFLNNHIDASTLPKAEGDLRLLQECDTQMLRIFDKICKDNNWTYWLDYGTLLGSVRHKGFIPWDDDLDVSMPREDYEKACVLLPEIAGKYGLATECFNEPMKTIGLGYEHKKTGIWLDVFPADELRETRPLEECRADIEKRIISYHKKYANAKNKEDIEGLTKLREKIISPSKTGNVYIYHSPEFLDRKMPIHIPEDIFPLAEGEFEGYYFPVPTETHKYTRAVYGNNYMKLPKSGVEHHGNDSGKLSDWAKQSGTDMKEVLKYLTETADELCK